MARNKKRHPQKVAQLKQSYTRVPHALLVAAVNAGMPVVYAVCFMLLGWIDAEDEDGNIYAHYSRAEIAKTLNLSEKQVTNAADALKSKGIIEVAKAGHKGRATQYKVCIGSGPASEPLPKVRYGSKTSTNNAIGSSPEAVPKEQLNNSSSTGRTLKAFSPTSNTSVKPSKALSADEVRARLAKAGE